MQLAHMLSVGAGHEGHMTLRHWRCIRARHLQMQHSVLACFQASQQHLMHWSANPYVEVQQADVDISRHIRLLRSHAVH